MNMANNTTYNLKSYSNKACEFLAKICDQINQNKDKKIHENAKEFYFKLVDSIDDKSLQIFLTTLAEYDMKKIDLIQTYQS